MKKDEFVSIMQELNAAYGERKFPLTKTVLDVWFKHLEQLNYSIVLKAVDEHIKTHSFPPAIAEILFFMEISKSEYRKDMSEIDREYRSIIGYYPMAMDNEKLRNVYAGIVKSDVSRAIRLSEKVRQFVSSMEENGAKKIPPLVDFIRDVEL